MGIHGLLGEGKTEGTQGAGSQNSDKGTLPHLQTVRDLMPRVDAFCEEVTKDLLDLNFADLSLVDLVSTDEVRNKLKEAQQAFTTGDRDIHGCEWK
jgi:hypothetical protein